VSAAGRGGGAAPSRLYGWLLRSLLPAHLARTFGGQMQDTFARLRRDARGSAGLRGEIAVGWREVSQLYLVGRYEKKTRADGRAAGESMGPPRGGRGPLGIDALAAQIRQGLRGLLRTPAFAATVVVTLALGVGANATMFGVIDRLLLQAPEHIEDPDRVVRVYVQRSFADRSITTAGITYPDFADLLAAHQLAGVAAFGSREITMGHGADAERVRGALATAGLFPLLGVQPFMGRFFSAEEDAEGAGAVVVLGYDFWRRLGADREVLGSELRLGGAPHTVIGVAPPGFTGFNLQRVDVWLPLHSPITAPSSSWQDNRGWYWLAAVARLADGATLERAAAEATALHRAGRAGDRYYDPEASVLLGSLVEARGPQRSDESVVARWLSGVSLAVLLVACANVANMLLARGVRQRREIGIRLALGVSRVRLVGQQLVESVMLALVGGLAALAVAYWGGQVVRTVLLPDIYWPHSPLDGRVLVFTFAAALAAGVVAGLVPALQATRQNVVAVLRGGGLDGGRVNARARMLLLVGQAALSVVLLVGAGLFVKSVIHLQSLDMGFDPERLIVAMPEFDEDGISSEEQRAVFDAAAQRLRALPAVEEVAESGALPFYWSLATYFEIPGREEELPTFSDGGPYIYPVTSDYLTATGIAIVRGRGFTAADNAGAPRVAVVGESMARAYWPDEDPIGTCVHINKDEGCTEIIGIAESIARGSFTKSGSAQYYVPLAQWPEAFSPQVLLLRADPRGVAALLPAVRREIEGVSPAVRYVSVQGFHELIDPQARSWELGATLFSAFGALALTIASVGLYGVLAFSVAQRRREIGLRSALGASSGGLVALVAGQATRLVVAGLLLGVTAALVAGPYIEPMLFQVDARDPTVFLFVTLVLVAVAVLAATVPSLRAARVHPLIALRQD